MYAELTVNYIYSQFQNHAMKYKTQVLPSVSEQLYQTQSSEFCILYKGKGKYNVQVIFFL
jgi:hypothetical protein